VFSEYDYDLPSNTKWEVSTVVRDCLSRRPQLHITLHYLRQAHIILL